MGCKTSRNPRARIIKLEEIQSSIKDIKGSSQKQVAFFDSLELALYMRQNPQSCDTLIFQILMSLGMENDSDSLELMRLLIQRNEQKGELFLRSYNDNTNLAFKLKQSVHSFYNEKFLKYLEVMSDIPLVRKFILEQTLSIFFQIIIEHLIILNCLIERTFEAQQVWWTDAYFQNRQERLLLTFPMGSEYAKKAESPKKKTIMTSFNKFLKVLKTRLEGVLIAHEIRTTKNKSSMINSEAIAQNHLAIFYQGMKQNLDIDQIGVLDKSR